MNSKEFIFYNILFFTMIILDCRYPESSSLSLRICFVLLFMLLWIGKLSERFKGFQSKWIQHLCSLLLTGVLLILLFRLFC